VKVGSELFQSFDLGGNWRRLWALRIAFQASESLFWDRNSRSLDTVNSNLTMQLNASLAVVRTGSEVATHRHQMEMRESIWRDIVQLDNDLMTNTKSIHPKWSPNNVTSGYRQMTYNLSTSDQTPYIPTSKLINGYSQWVQEYMNKGWNAFLLTFMFKPLSGGDKTTLNKMTDEVDRVYSTFITRVVREPHSEYQKESRPILIAAPDRPVLKNEKQKLKDIKINGGVHMHGILLVRRQSRLKQGVRAHFKRHEKRYVRNNLLRLNVQPIESNAEEVVGYALKSVRNRLFTCDELLIFPKAETEVRESSNG
jgi:hypothetical protein